MTVATAVDECVIVGCDALIPGNRVMCVKHWRMLPVWLQSEICEAYITRQRGGDARLYLLVIRSGIEHVAAAEKSR